MFYTNKNALDKIVRYKMRLITNKYSQVIGVDFNKVFISMAMYVTIICIFMV